MIEITATELAHTLRQVLDRLELIGEEVVVTRKTSSSPESSLAGAR